MATLKDSTHFVSADAIPLVELSTPFREVYSRLSRDGRGGFIVSATDGSRNYVKAYELAEEAIGKAAGDAAKVRRLADASIGQCLQTATGALVPVDDHPIDVSADDGSLRQQPERVFAVIEAGRFTGWFLNHESIRDTLTPKTVYVCAQGHENPDPDHGTCYSCPFPITGTKQA